MSLLDSIFGHWDNEGFYSRSDSGRLHTRMYPQRGCTVCAAEGWISASKPPRSAPPLAVCQQAPTPTPDPDSTMAYLALSAEEIRAAIGHLELVCGDSRVDCSVRRVALDALRDALTAVEAEMEAGHARP